MLYTLFTFSLLALSGLYLYIILANDLRSDSIVYLKDQMGFLKKIIHKHPSEFEDIKENINLKNSAGGPLKYFVRILDEDNKILIRTTNFNISSSLFPGFEKKHDESENQIRIHNLEKSYLLLSSWCQVGTSSRWRFIELASDLTSDEMVLVNYRKKLMVVFSVSILLSSLVGIVIARKGLRPLKNMTLSAKKITVEHLHERISQSHWPSELTDLSFAFDEMLGRLERSFVQISQFSADLAHELRTPISNLMGETEVALTRSRTIEDYQQLLGSNLEEYKKLSRLIDDMLFLARAENTQISIKKVLFDPLKEIQAIKEFYEALAEDQGIQILCNGKGHISGDPELFKRVITNLLSNAIKYTPREGKIVFQVDLLSDDSTSVLIQDTGTGILPDDLPHVFDRFYRGDLARSHDSEGTGLGLAIVKSIMDLHFGSINIQSKQGLGTTVILVFPSQ